MTTSNVQKRRRAFDGIDSLEDTHQDILENELDQSILNDRESGIRTLHRYRQAVNMDYSMLHDSGILHTNQYAERYEKMAESGINLLMKSKCFCYVCGHVLIVSSKESHVSNLVVVYCSNLECRHAQRTYEQHNHCYHPIDLSEI